MLRILITLMSATFCVSAAHANETLVDVVHEKLDSETVMPVFKVDAAWPKLPEDIIFGQVPGLAVDGDDNVWIVQRPNSLTSQDIGLTTEPPSAVACCRPAKHIMRFSPEGELLTTWGGEDIAPRMNGQTQWPANVHGIFVDDDETVWIGGNGDGDHVILNFTADGRFIRQIGKRGQTDGNESRTTLGNPSDIYRDSQSVLVADGYINKRLVQFDQSSLDYVQSWGAYGGEADASVREGAFDQSQASSNSDGGADPSSESFGDIVHCVDRGPDRLIYVCDRRNNRIQVFSDVGGKLKFVEDIVIAPDTGGTRTASDVTWSPEGTYLYVADMMNGRVWILDNESRNIIGSFGRVGRYPGQFTWLHSVEADSEGNIYTTEVGTGRRVQKFVLTGMAE